MADPLVLRQDTDGLATLTLNRPDKLNALTPAMFVELRGHLDDIAVDHSVGCVVVQGAGRSFCAGHDLDAIASGERAPSRHFEPETVDALERLPQPTIAKLHGHCFTGGLELALACDFLIASESTTLGDTHGQWGLAPIWGMSVRLPERVGRSVAKRLMFTSQRVTASEAAAMGLVDQCVPVDRLDQSGGRPGPGRPGQLVGHQPDRQAAPGRPVGADPRRGARCTNGRCRTGCLTMPPSACAGAVAEPATRSDYLVTMTDEPWPNRPWLAVMPTVAPST